MHRRIAAGIAAGAFLIGSAGAAFLIPNLVAAADPTASPAAASTTAPTSTSSSGSTSTATTAPNANPGTSTNCPGMPGGPGGMGSDDIAAAANALGMTEAQLTTALQGGETLAQVAAGQNVAVQTLIDAMVAAEKAELQAAVTAGTITQAQADQQIANLTQHETDEVNGVGPSGGPGFGHHGPPANPSTGTSGSSTTTSTTSGSATN
jgi:hypothetical protein